MKLAGLKDNARLCNGGISKQLLVLATISMWFLTTLFLAFAFVINMRHNVLFYMLYNP